MSAKKLPPRRTHPMIGDHHLQRDLTNPWELVERLGGRLKEQEPAGLPRSTRSEDALDLQARLEAFCSNESNDASVMWYESQAILRAEMRISELPKGENAAKTRERQQDARDMVATKEVTMNVLNGNGTDVRQFEDADSWVSHLCEINHMLIPHRGDKRPGELRNAPITAGGYPFADEAHLVHVLYRGFDIARELSQTMARAIALGHAIVEAHPFADANGRTSRAIMNTELIASGEEPLVQTFKFRSLRVQAYHQLRAKDNPTAQAVIEVAVRQQQWTAEQPWHDEKRLIQDLVADGHIKGVDSEEAALAAQEAAHRPSQIDNRDDDNT